MLNGDGSENCKKINSLINNKKNNFAREAHLFVHLFAVALHDHNVKLSSYTFYGKKISYVLIKDFVACVPVRYLFTAAHFYLAGCSLMTTSISHFLTTDIKYSSSFSNKIRLL